MLEMNVTSIEGEIITVENANGLVLRGLSGGKATGVKPAAGSTIYVSIRPEAFEAGPGDNTVKGTIEFVEFTGLSVNYLIRVNGTSLKAMIINGGSDIKTIGDEIELHIPPRNLYFLAE